MKMLGMLLIVSLLIGCRTAKMESSDTVERTNTEKMQNNLQMITITDRTVTITPPKQLSESIGCDTSRIETEYAVSDAYWDGSRLHHRIWNKSSFEVRAQHVDASYVSDSDAIEKSNQSERTYVQVEHRRLLEDLMYYSGWTWWCIALLIILIKVLK